ncbi:MAG: NAD(P)-binding protein, partial [Actinomycetota bacterium]
MSPKRRIAIVGAGPAGLSTAFHLTDQPGWSDDYDVDVYQLAWRVGGKGATGRNPDAFERIQEHGIHLFGNMYFNSLRMLKECYEQVDWDAGDRFRTIEEAFRPCIFNYNTDYWNGRWHAAVARFPDNDSVPWEGDLWPDHRLIVQSFLTVISFRLGSFLTPQREPRGLLARILWWLRRKAGDELALALGRIGEHLAREAADPRPPHPDHHDAALTLLTDVVKLLEQRYLERPDDPQRRFALVDIDLPVTILRGIVEDRLAATDIDSVDDENYRDWLARHGATETTLSSTLPQVYPNVSFGYEAGDTTKVATMAASAYVTFFLRQVLGKGAGGYFFAEGTGDTVMKPLYRLLVQRGVRIHFFHKLT